MFNFFAPINVKISEIDNHHGPSLAQSSERVPFISEFVGSILATDSCEKSESTLCRTSWVFSGYSGFLRQGKLRGWVRMNTVNKY
jgi:hypothetical protein